MAGREQADLINAQEAADLLDVARITVYSYVERGQLVRRDSPQGSRFLLLKRADVEALAAKRAARASRRHIDATART